MKEAKQEEEGEVNRSHKTNSSKIDTKIETAIHSVRFVVDDKITINNTVHNDTRIDFTLIKENISALKVRNCSNCIFKLI